jgi:hypothetical protein
MRRTLSVRAGAALLALFALSGAAAATEIESTPIPAQALRLIEQVNARLEAGGSPLRLTEASFFTLGLGTPSFRLLRIGSRWTHDQLTYVLDESDYTVDVPAAQTDAALVSGYDSWNAIANVTISTNRIADSGGNYDILDAIVLGPGGACVDIVDTTSPNLVFYDPSTGAIAINPEADVVMGGWLHPAYFANCLGSASILGVTWGFSTGDNDGDNYPDHVYVEQYYNEGFLWATSGAVYLSFSLIDIESIAVHENGHALGLDHFGGPNPNEPFMLQPNGTVFDPEAVMNPGYLGGDHKRTPMRTDVSALRTLYGRQGKRGGSWRMGRGLPPPPTRKRRRSAERAA